MLPSIVRVAVARLLCLLRPRLPLSFRLLFCMLILRTADGAETLAETSAESESEETAVAEMLLAWQDAPYESAIADL